MHSRVSHPRLEFRLGDLSSISIFIHGHVLILKFAAGRYDKRRCEWQTHSGRPRPLHSSLERKPCGEPSMQPKFDERFNNHSGEGKKFAFMNTATQSCQRFLPQLLMYTSISICMQQFWSKMFSFCMFPTPCSNAQMCSTLQIFKFCLSFINLKKKMQNMHVIESCIWLLST